MEPVEGKAYSITIPKQFLTERNPKDTIMKLRKNLEAVFLVAAVVTNFASYAVASSQASDALRSAPAAAAIDKNVPVVVVSAHRLSAAEKAALD